jgi:hypothetical protein
MGILLKPDTLIVVSIVLLYCLLSVAQTPYIYQNKKKTLLPLTDII